MNGFNMNVKSTRFRLKRLLYLATIMSSTCFFQPVMVYAADPTVQDAFNPKGKSAAADTTVSSIASPGWSAVIQTIVALAILVTIIYFLLKVVNRKLVQGRSSAGIRILSQQALTTNRSVHILEIGGQVYLLGVGESVTLLDKIEDKEIIRHLKEHVDSEASVPYVTKSIGYQKLLSLFPTRMERNSADGFKETLEKQLQSMRQMKETIDIASSRQNDTKDQT
jgi:flagellar protein FliO/FliZ